MNDNHVIFPNIKSLEFAVTELTNYTERVTSMNQEMKNFRANFIAEVDKIKILEPLAQLLNEMEAWSGGHVKYALDTNLRAEQIKMKITDLNSRMERKRLALQNLAAHFNFQTASQDAPPLLLPIDYSRHQLRRTGSRSVDILLQWLVYQHRMKALPTELPTVRVQNVVIREEPFPINFDLEFIPISTDEEVALLQEKLRLAHVAKQEYEQLSTGYFNYSCFVPYINDGPETPSFFKQVYQNNLERINHLLETMTQKYGDMYNADVKVEVLQAHLQTLEVFYANLNAEWEQINSLVDGGNGMLPEQRRCSICDLHYNANEQCPYVGACGHTFCLFCVKGMTHTEEQTPNTIRCPTCRKKSTFSKNYSMVPDYTAR